MKHKQRGAVLVVSLLMLLVMTLLAVSSISSSNVNLLIVNNVQNSLQTEAVAQQAIEQSLSDMATFDSPGVRTLTIAERQVEVTRARCLGFEPASGFSAKWSLAPEETMWQLSATTEDASVSGAIAHLTQGVRILMTAGTCTAAETST
jgi:type II secretory pathway component PulK